MKEQRLREIVREELLKEAEVRDSPYLQNVIDRMKVDFAGDEREFLDYIQLRLNQSYPDGDVTKEDVLQIAKEPSIRDTALNVDKYELIDFMWEG